MKLYCVRDEGDSIFGGRIVASENFEVTMLLNHAFYNGTRKWVSALYQEGAEGRKQCALLCSSEFQKMLGPLEVGSYTVIEVTEE